ncbi:MAG: hypothetical protein ACYDAY_03215 [Candidatus Dormibacteria bacterium]
MHRRVPATHEYDIEIAELSREIRAREEAQADPELIAELERERDVLKALLASAMSLWEAGEENEDLRRRFETEVGLSWDFADAYSQVYEWAVSVDTDDPEAFLRRIRAFRPEDALTV